MTRMFRRIPNINGEVNFIGGMTSRGSSFIAHSPCLYNKPLDNYSGFSGVGRLGSCVRRL